MAACLAGIDVERRLAAPSRKRPGKIYGNLTTGFERLRGG
jgi:hypothetical protein